MLLTHISLTDYRNFSRLDTPTEPGTTLLVGSNAQGKTSFLEAIYFLATFSAFTTSDVRQVVNFIAGREKLAVTRIVGTYQRAGREHRMEVRLILENNGIPGSTKRLRREVLLDGVKRKVGDMLGHFNAVLFLPQMLQIVEGSPEARRRYLDMTLSQVIPHYPQALNRYRKALTQRNALLKQLAERGGDPAQLTFWDTQLAENGAFIVHARIHAIHELEKLASDVHHDLSRGEEVLRLAYQPSSEPLPENPNQYALPLDAPLKRTHLTLEEIQSRLQQRLREHWREDIARGVTTRGPHRDDLLFFANGIHLGHYGSRGQVRTAMLSLKLAEVAWMKQKTGEWPVLLLDEMLAELDPQRRADLLQRLMQSEQVFATTTDIALFPDTFRQQVHLWHVHAGVVHTDYAPSI
ncbi:MAG: DNA replication/repair protein RecF [Anaerolineae bacterium]|nr:MAG: DNA replication/repair protein RecF [Anaerolineae bacterium]